MEQLNDELVFNILFYEYYDNQGGTGVRKGLNDITFELIKLETFFEMYGFNK